MSDIYAEPRLIEDLDECIFYHTMDVPGFGLVRGEWDLRGGEEEYLGGVKFAGKRVLEIGTADGFLTFHMERRGAEVVSYDLSEDYDWDLLPLASVDGRLRQANRKANMRRINNAYWLCHRACGSKARAVYGTVYDVPEGIGPVDLTTFGSVLLHVRDPFLALERALRLTRETVVVTELFRDPRATQGARASDARGRGAERRSSDDPSMVFVPDARAGEAYGIWWYLTPDVVERFLGVLGFGETRVTFHEQLYVEGGRRVGVPLYTVVGRRTHETE